MPLEMGMALTSVYVHTGVPVRAHKGADLHVQVLALYSLESRVALALHVALLVGTSYM